MSGRPTEDWTMIELVSGCSIICQICPVIWNTFEDLTSRFDSVKVGYATGWRERLDAAPGPAMSDEDEGWMKR
jgi:hypothetical protein